MKIERMKEREKKKIHKLWAIAHFLIKCVFKIKKKKNLKISWKIYHCNDVSDSIFDSNPSNFVLFGQLFCVSFSGSLQR